MIYLQGRNRDLFDNFNFTIGLNFLFYSRGLIKILLLTTTFSWKQFRLAQIGLVLIRFIATIATITRMASWQIKKTNLNTNTNSLDQLVK